MSNRLQVRVRCRNQRCRTKLDVPTDNEHKAFCARHCYLFRDTASSWAQHGPVVLEHMAKTEPARYAEFCGRLVPKDVSISIGQRLPGNLEPEDWEMVVEVMSAIKASIPDAGSLQPGQVMQHVLDVLRAHDAPMIEVKLDCPKNDGCHEPNKPPDEPAK